MLFVGIEGLNIKYLLSKISLSTNILIVEFSNQKDGIDHIVAPRSGVISSCDANLISLLQNSFLKLRAFICLSQCVTTR